MVDFETLTLRISQNSSTYFCKKLSYRVLSEPGKNFDSQPSSAFRLILVPTHSCYGLDVTRNSCTHFCRIRDGGGASPPPPPPPPPPTIFEGRNLFQQTIYHWKGNLSKSPIHFRYQQNILTGPASRDVKLWSCT